MPFLTRDDGVQLAYDDTDPGNTARQCMLLIHGWCGDRTALSAQASAFRPTHRVVSVDLRGYGASSSPPGDYTMPAYADDVAWLCGQLHLTRTVVVGHSMGGNVALEVAARHPTLPSQVVLVDSVAFPPLQLSAGFASMVEGASGPDFVAFANGVLRSLCLPTDAYGRQHLQATDSLNAPQHVVASSLRHHTLDYSAEEAAKGCKVPVAYIQAANPLADLAQLQAAMPQLQTARVLGSGHFAPQEVPEQVNAMIARFIRINDTPKDTIA